MNEGATIFMNRPLPAALPFLLLLAAGITLKVSLLVTAGFLYMGAWCVFHYRRCRTPHCAVTGPLFLLIAFFSLLRWVPPFSQAPSAWSSWNVLIPVAWLGTTAAFAAQWLITRKPRDLYWTVGLFAASLLDYLF